MAVLTHNSPAVATSVQPTNDDSSSTSSSKNRKTMNVLVKWNQGKTLCLQVHPEVRVADLALTVWEKAQAEAAAASMPGRSLSRDLCMVCRGKVLDPEDDRVLAQVVGAVETLQVQVWTRQRGGCFMVSCSILGIILAAIVGSTCTCGLSLLIVPVLLPLLFILPLCCL